MAMLLLTIYLNHHSNIVGEFKHQLKAIKNIGKHIEQNSAVDTHIIDLLGLSDDAITSMQQSLQNEKIRIIFITDK